MDGPQAPMAAAENSPLRHGLPAIGWLTRRQHRTCTLTALLIGRRSASRANRCQRSAVSPIMARSCCRGFAERCKDNTARDRDLVEARQRPRRSNGTAGRRAGLHMGQQCVLGYRLTESLASGTATPATGSMRCWRAPRFLSALLTVNRPAPYQTRVIGAASVELQRRCPAAAANAIAATFALTRACNAADRRPTRPAAPWEARRRAFVSGAIALRPRYVAANTLAGTVGGILG